MYAADLGAPLAADLAERGLDGAQRRVPPGRQRRRLPEHVRRHPRGDQPRRARRRAGLSSPSATPPAVTWPPGPPPASGSTSGPAASRSPTSLSQAGVLDLTSAYDQNLGGGAVEALMGAGPDDASYDLADPQRQVPLDVPVWCLHAPDDTSVPMAQSEDYVAAAAAAGAACRAGRGHRWSLRPDRHRAPTRGPRSSGDPGRDQSGSRLIFCQILRDIDVVSVSIVLTVSSTSGSRDSSAHRAATLPIRLSSSEQ